MARMRCKCDEIMSNGLAPNDIQYWVYSDRAMDSIESETIDVVEFWGKADYEVWLCPKCKRLYVFGKDRNIVKFVYQLETE